MKPKKYTPKVMRYAEGGLVDTVKGWFKSKEKTPEEMRRELAESARKIREKEAANKARESKPSPKFGEGVKKMLDPENRKTRD